MNRCSRGHEDAMMDLKKEASRLEEEIAGLRRSNEALAEENVSLKTLEKDIEAERQRRTAKEDELTHQEVEVEAKKLEIERLEIRLRVRGEEIDGLRKELSMMDELRGEVAELKTQLAKRDEDVVLMDQGCKAVLKKVLQEQADALYAGYVAKNKHLGDELDQYLENRGKVEEVENKLFQAEGMMEVLECLKEDHHVEIPDFTFDDLKKKAAEYEDQLELMVLEEFNSEKLRLELPDSIGAVDVEGIDLKAALRVIGDDRVEVGQGGGAEARVEGDDEATGGEDQMINAESLSLQTAARTPMREGVEGQEAGPTDVIRPNVIEERPMDEVGRPEDSMGSNEAGNQAAEKEQSTSGSGGFIDVEN